MKAIPEELFVILNRKGFWRGTANVMYRQRECCVDRISTRRGKWGTDYALEAALWLPEVGALLKKKDIRPVDLPFPLFAYVGAHGVPSDTPLWFNQNTTSAELVSAYSEVLEPWLLGISNSSSALRVFQFTTGRSVRVKKQPVAGKALRPFPSKLWTDGQKELWSHYSPSEAIGFGNLEVLKRIRFRGQSAAGMLGESDAPRMRLLLFVRRPVPKIRHELWFSNDGCGQGMAVYLSVCINMKGRAVEEMQRVEFRYMTPSGISDAGEYYCWHIRTAVELNSFQVTLSEFLANVVDSHFAKYADEKTVSMLEEERLQEIEERLTRSKVRGGRGN